MKMRVWEVAKEVGLKSKELLELARDNGIKVNSVLNALTDNEAKQLEKIAKIQKDQNKSKYIGAKPYEKLAKGKEPESESQKIEKQEPAVSTQQQKSPKIERPTPASKVESPGQIVPAKVEHRPAKVEHRQKPAEPQTEAESHGQQLPPKIERQKQPAPPAKDEKIEISVKDERLEQVEQSKLASHTTPAPVKNGKQTLPCRHQKSKLLNLDIPTPPKLPPPDMNCVRANIIRHDPNARIIHREPMPGPNTRIAHKEPIAEPEIRIARKNR